MNIKIGNTSKRINSTSQQFASSTTLSCKLKEPCSMQSPTFQVQGLTKGTLYNYCQFENRYYWVDDIVYLTNNIQEVKCHLDPLATYKSAIENTYAYVTYGDSAHSSGFVDDTRFGPDIKISDSVSRNGAFVMGFDTTNWSVALTVNASYNLGENGVVTYFMSYSTFMDVLNMFGQEVYNDWGSPTMITDMIDNFCLKILCGGGAALDNVKSATLVPIPVGNVFDPLDPGTQGHTTSTVTIGPYQITGYTGTVYIMNPNKVVAMGSVTIPLNRITGLNTSGAYRWLNSPKYCTIKISHPCGYLDINDPSLLNLDEVYVFTRFAPATGDYVMRITNKNDITSDTIAMTGGNVGIDVMSLINNTNGTIGGAMFQAMGSAVMSGVTSLASLKRPAQSTTTQTIKHKDENGKLTGSDEITTVTQQSSTSSGIEGDYHPGGFIPGHGSSTLSGGLVGVYSVGANGYGTYDVEYYVPMIFTALGSAAEYTAYCDEYGYPVNRRLKIGNITGYCECAGANVSGATGASEASKSTINSYLNNGIYIEA